MGKSLVNPPIPASASLALYRYRILPVLFFVVLPVLVVRMSLITVAPDATSLWETFFVGDVRSWWKAVFVVGTAIWMVVNCLLFLFGGWRPSRGLVSLAVSCAVIAVLISACLSDYPYTTWLGYTAQYEGGAVILSYLVGLWYTAQTTDRPLWHYRTIGFVGSINAALGILKGIGYDFWLSEMGRWVIGAGTHRVKNTFADTRMASGTVFQPNHFGMFMVVICLLSLGMLFYETRKGWLAFWVVNCVGACVATIFSNSRASVIILFFFLVVFAVIFTAVKEKKRHDEELNRPRSSTRKKWIIAVTGFVVALVFVFALADIRGAFNQMIGRTMTAIDTGESDLVAVDLHDGALYLKTTNSVYSLERKRNGGWVAFHRRDIGDFPSEMPLDRGIGEWSIVPVSSIGRLSLKENGGETEFSYDDISLRLVDMGGEVRVVDIKNRVLKTARPAAVANLPFSAHLFSGRGYIWSRALPLFWNHPWFGSGPGTFALVFPTTDLVGKQRYQNNGNTDKGHGIWIHYLVELGLIGWLAWFAIIVYVAVVAWRRRGRELLPAIMGAAGYLATSLTNDSTVGVTPVFIVLCGIILSRDGRPLTAREDTSSMDVPMPPPAGLPKKRRKKS
ncbi:MAG: O-antigen ligase family protein [Planctomycetaceae bacterium]|nr:O-antigen ligase family protein [Planctomycetaceae bacterium]